MNIGTALKLFADIIKLLSGMGIIQIDGNFRAPSAAEDTLIAARVEEILKNYGVDIPEKVDKVLEIIPIALSLAGVK